MLCKRRIVSDIPMTRAYTLSTIRYSFKQTQVVMYKISHKSVEDVRKILFADKSKITFMLDKFITSILVNNEQLKEKNENNLILHAHANLGRRRKTGIIRESKGSFSRKQARFATVYIQFQERLIIGEVK